MKVRFTKGQTYYNEVLVVNRGDFEMANIMLNPKTGLYTAKAIDWSKGPPYEDALVVTEVSLKEARAQIKAFLEPLPEPPAY